MLQEEALRTSAGWTDWTTTWTTEGTESETANSKKGRRRPPARTPAPDRDQGQDQGSARALAHGRPEPLDSLAQPQLHPQEPVATADRPRTVRRRRKERRDRERDVLKSIPIS